MQNRCSWLILATLALGACTTNFDVSSLPPHRADGGMDGARVDVVVEDGADDVFETGSEAGVEDVALDGPADGGDGCGPGEELCGAACVDTQSAAAHCGRCDNACERPGSMPDNAELGCLAGVCALRCVAGFADCDGSMDNGCEVDLERSPQHCGRCGNVCEAAANGVGACVAGRCELQCNANFGNCDGDRTNGCEVDLRTDVDHCQRCGETCVRPLNARATCAPPAMAGVSGCGRECLQDFGDCDGNAINGCEQSLRVVGFCGSCETSCAAGQVCRRDATTGRYGCASGCAAGQANCNGSCVDVRTDPDNCGACGMVCPAVAGSERRCVAGACMADCAAGFGDCDGDRSNGCETNLRTSAAHCGACTAACAPANAVGLCSAGVCSIASCSAGFADCNASAVDGCEVTLATDLSHCGRCNNRCTVPNVPMATCTMGVCAGACAEGFGDCNSNRADGCETALTTTMNCGACGQQCTGSQVCARDSEGRYRCQAPVMGCTGGQTQCSMACVDTRTDRLHCGGCNNACPSAPNGVTRCEEGACRLTCQAGFGDCDGNLANGCEVNLQASSDHCGACGTMCDAPGTTGACNVGMCSTVCAPGMLNCTADPGCETDGRADDDNCGACGVRCLGGAQCIAGRCECPVGQTLCGVGESMACVDTGDSPQHCGACGTACPAGVACVNGACDCPAGELACGGVCTAVLSNNMHCGACGNACPAGSTCTAGRCVCPTATPQQCGARCVSLANDAANCGACGVMCPTGSTCSAGGCQCAVTMPTLCSGMCVNTTTNVAHCGACGNMCPARANSTSNCVGGLCGIQCNAGFGNCNGSNNDGCEVNLGTNVLHCGACDNVCPVPANATRSCAAGMCRFTCLDGYADCDGRGDNGCEVNLNSSSSNCGECGRACGVLQHCRAGICRFI